MNLEFAKLHSLGNDFLIMRVGEGSEVPRSLASLAVNLCDRRCGIGADGIVFHQPTVSDSEADVSALIFNADGSRAEVSGNGLRCLAAFLHARGLHTGPSLRIRTVSGVRRYTLKESGQGNFVYESCMGEPVLDPSRVPALAGNAPNPLLDYPLGLGPETVKVSVCSLGNPHCSTFWPDLDQVPLERLGPLLERHAAFPRRTNVEFVQVVGRHEIRARFWERGVGHTLASGTGCSAAAVAAVLLKLAESPVTVRMERGVMTVRWKPGEELRLTGPADFICYGIFPLGTKEPGSA